MDEHEVPALGQWARCRWQRWPPEYIRLKSISRGFSICLTWVVLKMCTPAVPFFPLTTLSLPDKYMYLNILWCTFSVNAWVHVRAVGNICVYVKLAISETWAHWRWPRSCPRRLRCPSCRAPSSPRRGWRWSRRSVPRCCRHGRQWQRLSPSWSQAAESRFGLIRMICLGDCFKR